MESLHQFVVFQFALVKPGIKVLNRWEKEEERRERRRERRERGERGGREEREQKGIIDILTRVYRASFPYRGRVEDIRQEKVEQGPELMEVVLERGAGQEEAVGRTELSDNL